jgi:hypothetical protein
MPGNEHVALKRQLDNMDDGNVYIVPPAKGKFRCPPAPYERTAMIANYMNKRFNGGMGAKQFIVGEKVMDTRYGENPHQDGALYEFDKHFSNNFTTLKGEASFNNMTDINGAVKIAASFGDAPAVGRQATTRGIKSERPGARGIIFVAKSRTKDIGNLRSGRCRSLNATNTAFSPGLPSEPDRFHFPPPF